MIKSVINERQNRHQRGLWQTLLIFIYANIEKICLLISHKLSKFAHEFSRLFCDKVCFAPVPHNHS